MNNRIKNSNVQLGESFVLGDEKRRRKKLTPHEILEEEQKEREIEFKRALEKMLIEASNQGRSIVQDAQKKADEIIKNAEDDAKNKAEESEILKQQSIEQGYAEGFQKGYDEGVAKAREELIQEVWGLGLLATSAFSVKKEIINSAEQEILGLSTLIAEKIIRHQLEIKPELMREIVKAAIDQLKDKEDVKIIVNPALIQNLYDFAEELKEQVKGLKHIKITEDKTIPKSGVIVESPDSRIDGRIETQLGEIVKNLMQEFSEKSNSEEISKEIEIKIDETISKENKEK